MGIQDSVARRMPDPLHATRTGRLEEASARFRKRLAFTMEAAARSANPCLLSFYRRVVALSSPSEPMARVTRWSVTSSK